MFNGWDQLVRYVDWDQPGVHALCVAYGVVFALLACALGELYALWKDGELE